jgi:stalled ribosome alternative rescue factor ArfA
MEEVAALVERDEAMEQRLERKRRGSGVYKVRG